MWLRVARMAPGPPPTKGMTLVGTRGFISRGAMPPQSVAQAAAGDGGGALDGDGGSGQPRAQAAPLGDDDAHRAPLPGAPLALVVLVAAQKIEDARARRLRGLDGVGHEHRARAVAAEVEI